MKKYILAIIIIIIAAGIWKVYEIRNPRGIKINVPEAKGHQEFVDKNIDIDLIIEEIIEEKIENPNSKSCNTDNDCGLLLCSGCFSNDYLQIAPPDLPCRTYAEGYECSCIEGVCVEQEIIKVVKPEEKKVNNINLAVPFTSQAPTANWDQPFQDACEEASVLMAVYYYQNKEMPSKEAVEKIFIDTVAWQEEFMDGDYDITIAETGQFTKGYFGYDTEVIPNLTATKIRNLLREGIPVIVPANGHILINHNFTGDGPKYHMLVIKGFVDDKFITNDPGTRNGADFVYSEANLMEAIADWDKEKALTIGPKVGLILREN